MRTSSTGTGDRTSFPRRCLPLDGVASGLCGAAWVAGGAELRPGGSRRSSLGPVEVATETARAGRRIATRGARVIQDGEETVRVTAAFVDLAAAAGRTVTLVEKPALSPPEDSIDLLSRGAIPGLTITERVEYRVAAMPGWAVGPRGARAWSSGCATGTGATRIP